MQTRAIGISMRLEGDGFEEVHVCHNAAHRSAYSDYVHPENLQVSSGSILTLFGPPELVINVLRDLLEHSEAAVAEEAEQHWLARGNRRTGRGLDPRTVHHIHTVLHAAMERAVKWKLIPLNPVDSVDPPHVPRKEQAFLTAEESERVVEALDGDPYELPILVGLYCALRPAEYLALRWRDVDLKVGELRVTQNVHRVRQDQVTEHMGCKVAGFRFGPAKTHRSMRPVSMPKAMVDLLADWKRIQAAERLQAGPSWADLDLVFTDARGYPHNHDRVRRSFYRALKSAEVRQVVLYALRHTSATLTLADSKDLKLVASRLGHANQHLVLDTYGHLLPGADREAADRLGEIVKRRPRNGGHTDGTRQARNGTDGEGGPDS